MLLLSCLVGVMACAGCGDSATSAARPAEASANPVLAVTPPAERPLSGDALGRMQGYLPNTMLTTHENKRVRFYDDLIKGKVVLINFMFTSCQASCPLTTLNLARVQAALGPRVGHDVFLYSITLDPARDTPEVLERYAQSVGAKPGWLFLTGSDDDIEFLRRKLGAYDPDPLIDADKTQHAGVVVLGNDATGRWGAVPGLIKPAAIVQAVLRVVRG